MRNLYDKTDKSSIVGYAKGLLNKSLRDVCGDAILERNAKGKGRFGTLLEEFYFHYAPNSTAGCDFPEAGLELKSTPLKSLKNGAYVAKERLVLNIINYEEIVRQSFETSSLFLKNRDLLIVFYLYENGVDVLDYIIHLVDEWNFPEDDLVIIRRDWETIKRKVIEGRAHEISESDTYYLAACTKGATAATVRSQPFSEVMAKQRAYSLKQSYINYIISSISGDNTQYGKLMSRPTTDFDIEKYVVDKFEKYIGCTPSSILSSLNSVANVGSKGYYAKVSKVIMNVDPDFEIEEFKKAGIEIKTIRINKRGGMDEHMSLPSFRYTDIVAEDWDGSLFNNQVSSRYLCVFFKQSPDGKYFLDKVRFWSMPDDLCQTCGGVQPS